MRVSEEIRFDDNDVAPDGVCYTGIDRVLEESGDRFHVRCYDDEPESALESPHAKALVDFLAGEFGHETFLFLSSVTGRFEEIDRTSMRFKGIQEEE